MWLMGALTATAGAAVYMEFGTVRISLTLRNSVDGLSLGITKKWWRNGLP